MLLCRLALLLIHIAENESGESWHQRKKVFRPLLVTGHQTQHGVISQTNKLTGNQKCVLDGLNLKAPKRYLANPALKKA